MTTTDSSKVKKPMPKGGRKGGSVFPRIALDVAISYAKKLVSKTHTGPQPQDVVFSGVVGAGSSRGTTRISALKQYGLLAGGIKENYWADELAKRIVSAPEEELVGLYRQAMLKPTIFRGLFNTFQGDTVSKAKLKQRAAALKVHPEETTSCIETYLLGMLKARLVTVDGDQVTHIALSDTNSGDIEVDVAEAITETENEGIDGAANDVASATAPKENIADARTKTMSRDTPTIPQGVFQVNVTLDSSLDIEKLEKQLQLLKRYGAI